MTTNRRPKRHQWEDAVIESERRGLIPKGATNLLLRLATAINWNPKRRDRPGLYWKNEDAMEHVGSSRTTYYQHREVIFEVGLFEDVRGNLCPAIPSEIGTPAEESEIRTEDGGDESGIGTSESGVGTAQSEIRTGESEIRHPFPVDTFPEDSFPEDPFPDNTPAPASGREEEDVRLYTLVKECETTDALVRLWAENRDAFEKSGDLLRHWKERGRNLEQNAELCSPVTHDSPDSSASTADESSPFTGWVSREDDLNAVPARTSTVSPRKARELFERDWAEQGENECGEPLDPAPHRERYRGRNR